MLVPDGMKHHLWAVMNDQCPDGDCLLLMVTTTYQGRKHDPACELIAGDHPFIEHPSHVCYRLAHRSSVAHVKRMLAKGLYVAKEDFPGATFSKIASGIFASENCPRWAQLYAEKVGLD